MDDKLTGKKVGVISAGAWGTAVAKLIADNGNEVTVWDFMESVVANINKNHINERFLPGVHLPKTLKGSIKIEEAAGNKDFLIIASPSLYIMDIAKR